MVTCHHSRTLAPPLYLSLNQPLSFRHKLFSLFLDSHALTFSLYPFNAHSMSLSPSTSHSLSLSLSLLCHSLPHSFCHSFYASQSLKRPFVLSLSLARSLTLSLSLQLVYTHTHSLSVSFSLSLSLSLCYLSCQFTISLLIPPSHIRHKHTQSFTKTFANRHTWFSAMCSSVQ